VGYELIIDAHKVQKLLQKNKNLQLGGVILGYLREKIRRFPTTN